MNVFHVYINFPINLECKISCKKDGTDVLKEFQMTFDRADCEDGALLYYYKSNKDSFIRDLNILQDEDLIGNFGGYSFEESLNILLNETYIINCEDDPLYFINSDKCFFKHWITDTRDSTPDFPEILKEIAEHELKIANKANEKQILINFLNSYHSRNPINIIKDCRGEEPVFIYVNFVSNFIELDEWFIQNRIKRNFNFGDFRHIENHPQYIKGKSPLLGGIGGKQNAANILDKAVGDKREKKCLINYDVVNKCFIRYEDENTNATFHGYHLVKPITHEIDQTEINKISQRIILILEYRKKY